MSLAALLTLCSILLAVLALARPVGRRSLALFVPLWRLVAAILLSLVLIICRDAPFGVSPPFGWPLPVVQFGLTLGAFLIPVGAGLWSWATWHRARLTESRVRRVENVFQAALREREFDEVERILRKNQERLDHLPASAASVLFNPAMVAALFDSHSLIHLELLASMRFLKSLENRHSAVDAVIRELLRSDVSPLRSAVVSRYGGLEHLTYSDSERALIQKTFQNPEWYFEASAHYSLLMSAVEELRTGQRDAIYNDIGRDYEATQGVSARSHCPIYLAAKTELLAIEAALENKFEKDLYVTDLFDIFRAVLERSKFNETLWLSPLSNSEHPTPYAYLLYEITHDLDRLSAKALQEATSKSAPPRVEAPGEIARALALTWSFCIWSIADSKGQVGLEFRNHVIRQYLLFMLALDQEPSEISFSPEGWNMGDLRVWRDLFLHELKARFVGDSEKEERLKEGFESLDHGKHFVSEGETWLNKSLFG